MTNERLEGTKSTPTPPPMTLPEDFKNQMVFCTPSDEDLKELAQLRCSSYPWKDLGETQEASLKALTKLRSSLRTARLQHTNVGYITIERDGPVPGAAYLRNIIVKQDLRQKGLGTVLLEQGLEIARDLGRKTLALRVDPANGPAVAFYRKNGFTTVATVVSKKNSKLRLLMSREL